VVCSLQAYKVYLGDVIRYLMDFYKRSQPLMVRPPPLPLLQPLPLPNCAPSRSSTRIPLPVMPSLRPSLCVCGRERRRAMHHPCVLARHCLVCLRDT
jgi:hypothetical protein